MKLSCPCYLDIGNDWFWHLAVFKFAWFYGVAKDLLKEIVLAVFVMVVRDMVSEGYAFLFFFVYLDYEECFLCEGLDYLCALKCEGEKNSCWVGWRRGGFGESYQRQSPGRTDIPGQKSA